MKQMLRKRGLYASSRVIYLPVGSITPSRDQPRRHMEPGAMRELSNSISKYGVLQPLSVRRTETGHELISGERRLRAAMLAGLKEVPCIVMTVGTEESAVLLLVENLQRRGLDFVEEARALSRLVNAYGYSQEEVARLIGLTQPAVANKLRLLKLSPDLLYLIRGAGLTERHARALLRLPNEDAILAAIEAIVKRELNVMKTEEYIDELLSGPKEEERTSPEPTFIIKDVRLLLNTVARGVKMMQKSGIGAQCLTEETESEIVLTIKIPKPDKG